MPGRASRRPLSPFFFCLIAASSLAAQSSAPLAPPPIPANVSPDSKRWIGEYGPDKNLHSVFERDGKLWLSFDKDHVAQLQQKSPGHFAALPPSGTQPIDVEIASDSSNSYLIFSGVKLPHRTFERNDLLSPHIAASQQLDEIRKAALQATPPAESGSFRKSDLVELAPLDPAIHLDIRYATTNDFLGVAVYTQARAFLQRPAAEALVRALHKLEPLGYGLLVHDAYRPWYVTKVFWDATPQEGRIFVADPSQGSRHNRGCAVDLTLYDLKTGKPIEMTGAYDEMSPRSFPNYPGGTSLQRWHRELLRSAMESEGFTVYEYEWWHFDYKDWREYGIGNVPFEKLNAN